MKLAAQYGATNSYDPVDGLVKITFKNNADHAVTVDIFSEEEICDSEACALLKSKGVEHPFDHNQVTFDWKRVLIATIDSMDTSEDESYSIIKGTSVFGTQFEVTTIWWLIESPQSPPSCREWIPKYGSKYKEGDEKAYQFSGSYITNPVEGIFTDVGCSNTTIKEKEASDV